MSKKIDRATLGPSWTEVILGAVLSAILGVILGALLLVIRPVVVAKETPKDPDPKAIYYIEGSRDPAKAKQADVKRKTFVAGQSVTVTEDELNTIAGPATPAGAPNADKAKAADKGKAGDKGKEKGKEAEKAAPPPANADDLLATGAANVRINGGVVQLGVPVTINVLGLGQKVIVQARGGFVKEGSVFVFEPNEMYVGSCPVHRLPFLSGYVRNKVLADQPIPEDIKAAWMKLSNVAVEGNALKLSMQ